MMKRFFFVTILLAYSTAQQLHAMHLSCRPDLSTHYNLFFFGKGAYSCMDKRGRGYALKIRNYGPGLKSGTLNHLSLDCTAEQDFFWKRGTVKGYSIGASASALIVGLGWAPLVKFPGGTICTMFMSSSSGVGAELTLMSLELTPETFTYLRSLYNP